MPDIYYSELLQQCLSAVADEKYLDNHPERDSSGGESYFVTKEQILDTARKFVEGEDAKS